MRILVAESDTKLCNAMDALLKKQFSVDLSFNGAECLNYFGVQSYDGIILDWKLKDMEGIDVLRKIRETSSVPVMLLASQAAAEEIVAGLDAGADDFMIRPVDPSILMARLHAITRRKGEVEQETLAFEDLILVRDTATLCCGEEWVRLGSKEFQMMEMLMRNPGHVVRKEIIQEKIWGWDHENEYNSVEVYVSFLRRKIRSIQSKVIVSTIRGIGYCIGSGRG